MRAKRSSQSLSVILALNLSCSLVAAQQQEASEKSATVMAASTDQPQTKTQATSAFTGPLSDYVPCMFQDDDQYQMRARNSEEKTLDQRSANQLFNAANISIQTTLAKYQPSNPEFVEQVNKYLKDEKRGIYGEWLVGETPTSATIKIQNVLLEAINSARSSFRVRRSLDDIRQDQTKAAAAIRHAVEQAFNDQTRIPPTPTDINDLILKGKQTILSFAGRNNLSLGYLQSVANDYSLYFNDTANVRRNADFFALATKEAAVKASGQPYGAKNLNSTQESSEKERLAAILSQAVGSVIDKVIRQDNANAENESKIAAAKQAINRSNYSQQYRTSVAEKFEKLVKSPDTKLSATDYADAAEQAARSVDEDPVPDNQTSDRLIADLKDILNTKTSAAINQSQASAKPFLPPNDISCSMALLSWKETRDIFGRRVANTFVGIQVNLRNLNTKNEFLVHDIQVAVDTGIDANHFGRFQAGRDKLLVRAVAQKGQTDDRRNVALSVLSSVGAIAGASSLVAGTVEFKNAVAVFQGAFLTGFSNIFPDHTVDYLNHISDLVFSASNTSKVIVPVQGSVPLVTFISEKPVEQLPYAWCGHPPKSIPSYFIKWGPGPEQNCDFNGGKHAPGYVSPYRYSGRQLEPEKNAGPSNVPEQPNPPLHPYPLGPTVPSPQDSNYNETAFEDGLPPWKDLAFRNWRAAAVRMLQEHTFVVVGGVHIQQVVTQPHVSSLACAHQLNGGQLDLSKTNSDNVECTVSGSGLNLVTGVDLEKADSKIIGTFKVGSDGNTATIQFTPNDKLCSADGTYSLFVTYKSDTQKDASPIDTGNKLQLTPQPVLSGAQALKNNQLTLSGSCLDKMDKVTLTDSDKNAKEFTLDAANSSGSKGASQRTANYSGKDKLSGTYTITYKVSQLLDAFGPSPAVTVTEVTGDSGTSQSNGANQPAAPSTNKKKQQGANQSTKPATPGSQ